MNAAPAGRKRRFAVRPTTILIGAMAVFALFIIAAVLLVADRRRELEERIAAIRARGEPMTLDELDAYVPNPKGPNAADTYLRAFRALRAAPPPSLLVDDLDLGASGGPISGQTLTEARTYLAGQAETLDLLAAAGEIEECRFQRDYSDLNFDATIHLLGLRDSMNLLLLQSAISSQAGDVSGAVESVVQAVHTLGAIRNQPTMIGHSFRRVFLEILAEGVERLCTTSQLEEGHIDSLNVAFEKAYRPDSMAYCFITERAYSWGMSAEIDERYPALGAFDQNHMLIVYEEVIALSRIDRSESVTKFEELLTETQKLPFYLYPLTRISMPVFLRLVHDQAKAGSAYPLIMALLSIERYRARHGQLPERLEDIWEAPPADETIVYAPQAIGYEIYLSDSSRSPAITPKGPNGERMLAVLR